MARINGSIGNTSHAEDYEFYIIWSESEVNIANNTSKLTATSYIYCKNHSAYNYNVYDHFITIDGTKYTTEVDGISLSPGKTVKLATGSKVITHSADGSKKITISASSPNLPAGAGYGPSSGSASGTATLTTIPRASSVTCADGNIGSSTTININRASSSFTHTITYNFSGLTGTIATKTTSTSIGWTIPTSFFAKIPNSKNGQGTITCQTYNGNTLIGSSTCTFNAFVINSNPTVSATVQDVNSATTALTGDANKIVKYFSNAKVVTTATPKNSATINSVKVSCSNKSGTGADITLTKVESNVFNITATDSRGFATSIKITKTLVNYIKCAITSIRLERLSTTSNTVKATIIGNIFNASFGIKTNTLTLKWRYRLKGGTWSAYTNLSPTLKNNTFSYSGNLGTTFDFQEEYDFEVVATDLLMSETRTIHVTRGIPIIDIGKDDVKVNGDLEVKRIVTGASQYLENGEYGVNLNNSDIFGVNSVWFNDESNSYVEGINFLKQNGDKNNIDDYECLRGYRGYVYYNDKKLAYEHPIGSVVITSTNTNPGSSLGGTWTLIDKEFKSLSSLTGGLIGDTSKCDNIKTYYSRSGHNINLEMQFNNKVAIGDSTIKWGTINLSTLGISRLNHTTKISGWADGGNAILMFEFSYLGAVSTVDIVGVDSMPVGETPCVFFSQAIHFTYMLDSACDKFYWKRTS